LTGNRQGKLHFCRDDTTGTAINPSYVLPPGATLTKDWCLASAEQVNASVYHAAIGVAPPPYQLPRSWVNRGQNFDNIVSAVVTLFSISTTELWVDTMGAGIDAVGIDLQPLRDAQPAVAAFFVVFMIFGAFFVLQLFVSVTIEKVKGRSWEQLGQTLTVWSGAAVIAHVHGPSGPRQGSLFEGPPLA
jgi:hypothetical protein